MASSIAEIQAEIIAAKEAQAELAGLDSTSKVAMWRLWTYVVAVVIWTLENILEQAMSQQTNFINNSKIHSTTWYSDYAKRFQYGYSLPWGEVEYDTLDETAQVVKFAATTKVPGGLMIKVAGLDGSNELTPITTNQFNAFQEYMFRVGAAGDNLYYRNEEPDSLKLTVKIFYDPLVLDSTGKRLDGTNDTPVEDALDAYIKGIDFNGGKLVEQDMVDKFQGVEGVRIADVQLLQTKYSSLAFVDVPAEGVIPFAGYVRINDPLDLEIEYEAL